MGAILEVPQLADLAGLPVEVTTLDAPGTVSVTAWANDGAVVTLTWDEIAGSVSVRWVEHGTERLALERESVSKVSVRGERDRVEFWVWLAADGLGGQLVVRVGEHVGLVDAILRK
jgi:hypothetical protein